MSDIRYIVFLKASALMALLVLKFLLLFAVFLVSRFGTHLTSPNDPKHYSLLEHKHKKLDTILDDAFNKGDISGPSDLKFYVKQAMACQNLLIYTDGYCAFTRLV